MQNPNTIFRSYPTFGYITDNRNFTYKKLDFEDIIGDKILSASGSIFFSCLERKPLDINILAKKILKFFPEIDESIIINDATEFYISLEKEGFIICGKSHNDCLQGVRKLQSNTNVAASKIDSSHTSEDFFDSYYADFPQLKSVHIEVTSKCNERCLHCYIPHENKNQHICPNLFYQLLDQCYQMKVQHITISGGEPMLHNDLKNFLEKCREYNFSVSLLTNLTLLDDELLKEINKNPLLEIQVSLYSMDANIHDEITQTQGSFLKTKSGIKKLIDNNITFQISCPIMKQNRNSYSTVLEWANNHNISVSDDYVIIAKYNNTIQNLDSRLSTNEIMNLLLNQAKAKPNLLSQISEEVNKRKLLSDDDNICDVCSSSLCVSEKGKVYPCAGWQGCFLGDINSESLESIWKDSKKIFYLRNLKRKDFPQCCDCIDKEYCTICLVRNANESSTGNLLEVNKFFCDVAKCMKEFASKKI